MGDHFVVGRAGGFPGGRAGDDNTCDQAWDLPDDAGTRSDDRSGGRSGSGRARPGASITRGDQAQQALLDLLRAARDQHFLGPGDVQGHIAHSLAFAQIVPEPPARAVDLGSGAGVPGLVLALHWPNSEWVLLDANERRTTFLRGAVPALGLGGRVQVVTERAEVAGRDPERRACADLVVARGFGSPAVTAECAAPLLRAGGALVVAEPPGGAPRRWPRAGLALLGLAVDKRIVEPVALQSLRQVSPCPDRYPRRLGVPAKRPLF